VDVNGNLTVVSPDSSIYAVQLKRTDEEDRTHKWMIWHMNQPYGMNSFQIWEYRTDSNGDSCGGILPTGYLQLEAHVLAGGDVTIGRPESMMNLDVYGSMDGAAIWT